MFQRHVLFAFGRPRNGFLRVLGGLLGAALLLGLLAFGFVALLVLLVVGGVTLLVRQWRQPAATPDTPSPPSAAPVGVIEGEFTVVRDAQRVTQP